jgi:hypothetical protein
MKGSGLLRKMCNSVPQKIKVVTNDLYHFFPRDNSQKSLLNEEKCVVGEHLSTLLFLIGGPH